jgi:hypothetical protein
MENPFRIIATLPAFGAAWVSSFALAVLAMFAGNFVFHLSLPDIVDGELAVHLVVMALAEAFFFALTLYSVVRGDLAGVLRFASQLVIYLLNIFPALLAYDLYAGFARVNLVGRARIYDGVLALIDTALGLGGHRIVAGLNRVMSVNRQLAEPTVDGLRLFALAVSVALAALSLVNLMRRAGESGRASSTAATAGVAEARA